MTLIRSWYQVNEIFTTVQGEGIHAGVAATFIRLQGCAVGCPWCDTKYTWAKGGERMRTEDILARAVTPWVVITGGEPTLWNLDAIIGPLRERGHRIQLETSGQNPLKGNLIPDWVTCSPKRNLNFEIAQELRPHVRELKYVLDDGLDEITVLRSAAQCPDAEIVIMPEGSPPTDPRRAIAFDWAVRNRWRYSDRLQYLLGVK